MRARRCVWGGAYRLLPEASYPQWVLTFPWELRSLLAMDRTFLTEWGLEIVVDEPSDYEHHRHTDRGRRRGEPLLPRRRV